MNKSLISSALCIVVTAFLGASSAWAHSGASVEDAYAGDERSHIVTHRYGCVRTSEWTSGDSVDGCDSKSMSMTLEASALFNHDSTNILPGGQRQLKRLAADISGMSVSSMTITGHTDSSGSAEYNKDLSMRRAQAVRNYLTKRGVKATMRVKGMGESRPVADNATASGRAKNRRVEVDIRTN